MPDIFWSTILIHMPDRIIQYYSHAPSALYILLLELKFAYITNRHGTGFSRCEHRCCWCSCIFHVLHTVARCYPGCIALPEPVDVCTPAQAAEYVDLNAETHSAAFAQIHTRTVRTMYISVHMPPCPIAPHTVTREQWKYRSTQIIGKPLLIQNEIPALCIIWMVLLPPTPPLMWPRAARRRSLRLHIIAIIHTFLSIFTLNNNGLSSVLRRAMPTAVGAQCRWHWLASSRARLHNRQNGDTRGKRHRHSASIIFKYTLKFLRYVDLYSYICIYIRLRDIYIGIL